MKPFQIFKVLDLALEVRKQNKTFNPLFVGPAGVGKSEIIQDWCRQNEMPFIDLRAAYLESPDMIGFPQVTTNKDGREVTRHVTPEFWPVKGQGVVFLDEPNRGQTAVLNTFMQLLTDRKIHEYVLPKGWMIVAAINPETGSYDVNTMDAALKNRFAIFDVHYDKKSFVDFMKLKDWDQNLIRFIESNTWTYVNPEDIQDKTGVKYISPRTFSQMNNVLKAGLTEDLELPVLESLLGHNVAKAYIEFQRNDAPVQFDELIKSKKSRSEAMKKLATHSHPDNYKGGHIAVTISDVVNNHKKLNEELLAELCLTLPADQSTGMIAQLEEARGGDVLNSLVTNFPEVKKHFKSMLKNKEETPKAKV